MTTNNPGVIDPQRAWHLNWSCGGSGGVSSDLTTACRRLYAISQCIHLHGEEVMILVAKAKKRAKPKKPTKAKKPVRRAPSAAAGAPGGATAGLTPGSAHHEHTVYSTLRRLPPRLASGDRG
jgi:hypothetical protein